jgi:Ca2+-binding RTX toxin-like protein
MRVPGFILTAAASLALVFPVSAHGAASVSVSSGDATVTGVGTEADNITATLSGSTLTVTASGSTLSAGAGCGGSSTVVTCTIGFFGTVGANLGDGNDIWRSETIDRNGNFNGGNGNDQIYTGGGTSFVNGDAGSDWIDAGMGADSINGGADTGDAAFYTSHTAAVSLDSDGVLADDGTPNENDTISNVEILLGGSGDDTIDGSGAVTYIAGGLGSDTLSGDPADFVGYWERSTPVRATVGVGGGDPLSGENDTFDSDILNLSGGAGADTLIGNGSNNQLWGGWSGLAPDVGDTIRGGGGADTIYGFDGSDTADYSDKTGAVTVTLNGAAGDGTAGENDLLGNDIENVIGGSGNDAITGNAAANTLKGGAGTDTLTGAAGADVFDAREGEVDTIDCGTESDSGTADLIDNLTGDCEAAVVKEALPVDPPDEPDPPTTDGGGGGSGGGGTTDPPVVTEPPTSQPPVNPDPSGATDTGPAPDPDDTEDSEPIFDDDNPLTPQAPIKINAPASVEVAANGNISLEFTCKAIAGSCVGDVSLYENSGNLKASSKVLERRSKGRRYKRGKLLARRSYNVRAGRRKNVTVRLNRNGRRRVIKSRKGGKKKAVAVKAIIAITMKSPDGSVSVSEKAVTLKERRVTRSRSGKGRKR